MQQGMPYFQQLLSTHLELTCYVARRQQDAVKMPAKPAFGQSFVWLLV